MSRLPLSLQVILATNIAESSVTIPGVAYVIDSCRSLQVYWDPIRKTDSAGLVWASKSQVAKLTNILMIFIENLRLILKFAAVF
jgi:hypothetical protein